MAAAANPDDFRLEGYAAALADAIEAALPGWVERSVEAVLSGRDQPSRADVARMAAAAGRRAASEVVPAVRALLLTDVDEQRSTPLALLRGSVRYPTEVLRAAGAPPVERDGFSRRAFPDDVYDLTPATLADVDPSLHEPGLAWGAAKAQVHLARRRAEGAT